MASVSVESRPSTADPRYFAIEAATRKFETREDLLPFVKPLIDAGNVEEVHLSGNTYGIDACKFLGEILSKKISLKVPHLIYFVFTSRSLSLRIFSLLVFVRRSPSRSRIYSTPFSIIQTCTQSTSPIMPLGQRPKNRSSNFSLLTYHWNI
jgi:hypothetical protein